MPDHLRLTLTPDDDGTAQLHAEVVANGFCGQSSAWFYVSAIADFAATLGNAFPLSDPVELRGAIGVGSVDMASPRSTWLCAFTR